MFIAFTAEAPCVGCGRVHNEVNIPSLSDRSIKDYVRVIKHHLYNMRDSTIFTHTDISGAPGAGKGDKNIFFISCTRSVLASAQDKIHV